MTRSVDEWIGKTDDDPIPKRVQLRIFERAKGKCASCGRSLRPGHFDFDHIRALSLGGQHKESNIHPLCKSPCHKAKTAEDVHQKSINYRKRIKHHGIRSKSVRSIPGTRASGWKHNMDGTWERRGMR